MTVPVFALGIILNASSTEDTSRFRIQSENRGLPKEVLITLLRAWLKREEEFYYNTFKESGYVASMLELKRCVQN